MDPRALLDQFLGSRGGPSGPGAGGALGGMRQRFESSSLNSFGGGAAVGGVLGLLLGNKKIGRLAGGAMGYGGAAVLGALALKAYEAYRQGQSPARVPPGEGLASLAQVPPQQLPHSRPAADGSPFELVLMRAMVGAAKSDGHIDAREQQHLFEQVERLDLDAESKACVFDMLSRPLDLQTLDASIGSDEQRAEVYLAARLATDADHPAERAYLDALAARLQLPAALRAHLDSQMASVVASA